MTADDPLRAALYQVEQFRDHHCDCIGDWVCPVHHALDALSAVLDLCEVPAMRFESSEFVYVSEVRAAIAIALGLDE